MLTLYHGRTSVCSVKVRLALAKKGVAFDSRLLTLSGDQFDPDYMKLNPNAVVPTLSGQAWITGFAQYVVDPEDPFPDGFTVGDIWGAAG